MWRGPSYQHFPIDLSTAGTKIINDGVSVITFVRAENQDGTLALDAKINIQVGDMSADVIPASVNTILKMSERVNAVTLSWAAQSGVTAWIMMAPDDKLIVHAPPAKQLVTSSVASGLTVSAVSVGTAVVLLAASVTSRQSVVIQNNGANDIYLGGSGVTVATGLKVPANGGNMTIDKTTAALYAISAVAGNDVRVLVEA